jgi:endonuclease/exonuclease/phosphatase family metal-dependent hydrolase
MWEDAGMADPGAVAGGVRVATLNLWGLGGDWPARRAVIADGLRALRPDLVACERLFDQPVNGVWASDHFGVTADLAVP